MKLKEFYNINEGKESIVVDEAELEHFRTYLLDKHNRGWMRVHQSIFEFSELYKRYFSPFSNIITIYPSNNTISLGFGQVRIGDTEEFSILKKEKSTALTEFDLLIQKHRNDISFLIMSIATTARLVFPGEQQEQYNIDNCGAAYYGSIPIATSETVKPGLIYPVYKK